MPTIRKRVATTTTNALSTEKFRYIGGSGAVVNLWAAGVTNSDDIGLSINSRDLIVSGTDINIESSADVIDTDRDQVLYNEVVEPGELYLPVTVTTEMQFLLSIKPL